MSCCSFLCVCVCVVVITKEHLCLCRMSRACVAFQRFSRNWTEVKGWTADLFLFLLLPSSLIFPGVTMTDGGRRYRVSGITPPPRQMAAARSARPWTGQKSIFHHLKSIKRGFLRALQLPACVPFHPPPTTSPPVPPPPHPATPRALNQTLCSYN